MQAYITRDVAANVASEIRAAMRAIAERNGLTVKVGAVRWSNEKAACSVTFETGDAAAQRWQMLTTMTSLTGISLGTRFEYHGKTYTITDGRPYTRKPVVAKRADNGRIYYFPARAVNVALGRPADG